MEGARTGTTRRRAGKRRQPPPQTPKRAMNALTTILLIIICFCSQPCHAQQQGGRAAVGIGARVKNVLNNRRSRGSRPPPPSATTTSASATSTHSSVVNSETGESSSFPWSFLSSGSSGAWDDGVGVGGAVFLTMMLVLLGSYAAAAARMGSRTTVRSMIDGEWVFVSACGACLL